MTVGVAVKVYDGIALAADSATTISLDGGSHQVYNNANKILHLHRRLPIGAMTWGLGCIGDASITTVMKDLRRRLMGRDADHPDWALDADAYTVRGVAERLIELVYDELYVEFGELHGQYLGFLVAGYSGRARAAEGWVVNILGQDERPVPTIWQEQAGFGWGAFGQPEAAARLFKGCSPLLAGFLREAFPAGEVEALESALLLAETPPVMPSMPFADALNLARFIVDVTVGFNRYLLGPDTVGGPVEVAAITRHEGFKWVQRKHYYGTELNPRGLDHDA